jgi:hypothetical protein
MGLHQRIKMFLHGKGKTTRQTRAYKMGEKTPLPAEK